MDQSPQDGNGRSSGGPVSREQLYQEIWSQPAMHLGAKYGVSGSFLARVCDRLRVPRPRPGYWNKLAVGKAPPQPSLPDAEPGDELEWFPYGTCSSPERTPRIPKKPITESEKVKPGRGDALTPDHPTTSPRSTVPTSHRKKVPRIHPLMDGVVGLIQEGKVTREGYYRPRKRLLPDITTSPKQLDTAARLANQLYRQLESHGHRVRIANASEHLRREDIHPFPSTKDQRYHDALWRPDRPTVVYIDSVAIGLSLFERCESVEMLYVRGQYVPSSTVSKLTRTLLGERTLTSHQLVPSGEFCVQAYSPYSGATWLQQWRGKPSTLSNQFGEIIELLASQPSNIRQLIEQARSAAERRAREWEKERQGYIREEQAKRRAKALQASYSELLDTIGEWAEHKRIIAFFEEAKVQASRLPLEAQQEIEDRMEAAGTLLAEMDPLTRLRKWRSPEEIYEQLPKSHWER